MDEGFLGNINAGLIDKNNNNGDGFMNGGCSMWIVFLFFMMAFWGGGSGRANASNATAMGQVATQQDIINGFNFNQLDNGIRGLERNITNLGYDNLAQNDGTKMAIMEQTNSLGNQIADSVYQMKDCCCTTNRNIDSVKAEAYKNTCDITTAIHSEGEATRALITQNQMQELRDRLADRDRDLLAANFQLSQVAQSSNIINRLQPMPHPAYTVNSPYQSINTCGCTVS